MPFLSSVGLRVVRTQALVATFVYVLLVALSMMVEDLRYAFFASACASLIFFTAGFLVLRIWKGALSIDVPVLAAEDGDPVVFTIQGRPYQLQGYEQELVALLRLRHLPELTATAILSVATLYVLIFQSPSIQPILDWGGFQALEFTFFVGWLVLILNVRWFSECRFLSGSHVALGQVLSKGYFGSHTTYQFRDHTGDRRGGTGPISREERRDNIALLFYRPENPDENAPNAGLWFHRFEIRVIPKRNRMKAKETA